MGCGTCRCLHLLFLLFSASLLFPGKCTAPYCRLAGWRFRGFTILGLNYVGYGELMRLPGPLFFPSSNAWARLSRRWMTSGLGSDSSGSYSYYTCHRQQVPEQQAPLPLHPQRLKLNLVTQPTFLGIYQYKPIFSLPRWLQGHPTDLTTTSFRRTLF